MKRIFYTFLTALFTTALIFPFYASAEPIGSVIQTITGPSDYIVLDETQPPPQNQDQNKKEQQKEKPDKSDDLPKDKLEKMINKAKKSVGDQVGLDCSAYIRNLFKTHLDINPGGVTDNMYYNRLVLSDDEIKKIKESGEISNKSEFNNLILTEKEFKKLKRGAVYAKRVAKKDLQPGDVVFYRDTYDCDTCNINPHITHVQIYVGKFKKGGESFDLIDTSLGNTVVDGDLLSTYTKSMKWYGAKRYYIKQ
ncbi:NlpC/P60 family protein [Seinonella peptonophila]|uniref:NlpC/P60 family protein n=1 Tax=Seinonella peptonophila TaxID=112248 RepID=A0A1M4VG50_9BACL|nr:NlpC/P60 family protein [Seinonella peptonophila]SHE67775.1 NlpC/P60 family protein [Seinonella peptonophila]